MCVCVTDVFVSLVCLCRWCVCVTDEFVSLVCLCSVSMLPDPPVVSVSVCKSVCLSVCLNLPVPAQSMASLYHWTMRNICSENRLSADWGVCVEMGNVESSVSLVERSTINQYARNNDTSRESASSLFLSLSNPTLDLRVNLIFAPLPRSIMARIRVEYW